jgi:hypothetical protein
MLLYQKEQNYVKNVAIESNKIIVLFHNLLMVFQKKKNYIMLNKFLNWALKDSQDYIVEQEMQQRNGVKSMKYRL